MSTLEQRIREWAMDNYSTSYGASVLIECFDDGELEKEFKSLADAKRFAQLKDGQYADINSQA